MTQLFAALLWFTCAAFKVTAFVFGVLFFSITIMAGLQLLGVL